jgi:hypothetical protein
VLVTNHVFTHYVFTHHIFTNHVLTYHVFTYHLLTHYIFMPHFSPSYSLRNQLFTDIVVLLQVYVRTIT